MARLTRDADGLVLELVGLEKLWAVRLSPVRVPLPCVKQVRDVDEPLREVRGLRVGTVVPGLYAAGYFLGPGFRDFVVASRKKPGVVVELEGHAFARLVVSGTSAAQLSNGSSHALT